MVTAATVQRENFFDTPERLTLLETHLLTVAKTHEIQLEAWAVFSNHYHFVAHSPTDRNPIARAVSALHTISADLVNQLDSAPGRGVWFNYWDTCLTFEKSYLARLNYVHQNPVKHGLVRDAKEYPWCSAAWFESTATPAQIRTIRGFKIDRVNVDDEYLPVVRDRP